MLSFSHDGLMLAYLDQPPTGPDRGEPIVLIHGFASNHAVNWVNTQWVRALAHDGRRVLALDNRGHGRSDKPRDPARYHPDVMARDVIALLDHAGIGRADVMGYSLGARIAAHVAIAAPARVRALLLGGLGLHLVEGEGLPPGIPEALEATDPASITRPVPRLFRAFAEQNGGDLLALAACMRGSRRSLAPDALRALTMPVLVSVGTQDTIAGPPEPLAALLPRGEAFAIAGRDHHLAVGDRSHKARVLAFLSERP